MSIAPQQQVQTLPTWEQLIAEYYTRRLLLAAYWHGELTYDEEKVLEDSIPPEILIGYKPIK